MRAFKEAHGNRGFRGAEEGEGAVRLRVPDEGATVVHDVIRGETTFEHVHLDDPVIARADGTPLYNFAVAVDDLDAGITHVVRGEDHLSNTPKQLLVLEALGAPPPVYAHLPLLHGPDGKKLSKRHGAASVQDLRDAGYLPEAVRNYVALLGWGYDDETTFHTIPELQERFRLERVSKNPALFDEQKLRWMNGRYVRELDLDELTARLETFTGRSGLRDAVAISREKISDAGRLLAARRVLLRRPGRRPGCTRAGARGSGRPRRRWRAPGRARAVLEPWTEESVQAALDAVAERLGVKPKHVFQPVRVALAGTTVSPGIFETLALLGRDETLRRIDHALNGRRAG